MSGDRSVPDDHREWRMYFCREYGDPHGTDSDCGCDARWLGSDMDSVEVVPASWRVRAVAAEERAATLAEAIRTHRGEIWAAGMVIVAPESDEAVLRKHEADAALWAALDSTTQKTED